MSPPLFVSAVVWCLTFLVNCLYNVQLVLVALRARLVRLSSSCFDLLSCSSPVSLACFEQNKTCTMCLGCADTDTSARPCCGFFSSIRMLKCMAVRYRYRKKNNSASDVCQPVTKFTTHASAKLLVNFNHGNASIFKAVYSSK